MHLFSDNFFQSDEGVGAPYTEEMAPGYWGIDVRGNTIPDPLATPGPSILKMQFIPKNKHAKPNPKLMEQIHLR